MRLERTDGVVGKGRHGPAKTLADDIITAQTVEIEEMNELLDKS